MKKTLCIIFAALLALCLVSCSAHVVDPDSIINKDGNNHVAGGEDGSFSYEITELNTVRITGYSGPFEIHDVTIPAEIEGIEVTDIGPKAFYYANNISSITLPDSIKVIDEWAFAGCDYLASVNNIPVTVNKLGKGAFYKCTAIKSIALPSNLHEIGEYCFYECTALESIDIPASVTAIGNSAFWGCTALKTVSGLSGLTTLGAYAFNGCKALASITVPATAEVGEYAFNECEALKTK